MKILTSLAVAATLALSGPALAQSNSLSEPANAPVSNPSGVLPNVSLATIEPVLREAGVETQITTDRNGQKVLLAQVDQLFLQFRNLACPTEDSCAGLWMVAFIDDSEALPNINLFNTLSAPVRASELNNQVVLDRYLVADYGITRGSLIVNVGVLAGSIQSWWQFSDQTGPVNVSFEPLLGPSVVAPPTIGHNESMILSSFPNSGSINRSPNRFNIVNDR